MLISFIIVEYHSIEELTHCIDAIDANVSLEHEIIVSSNSCYDKIRIASIPQRDGVKWVFNEKNGGYAYALNCGLRVARGEYLVLSNPDCIIGKGIDRMVGFLQEHPEVGIIAPQIRDSDGNIQDTAREYVSLQNFVYRQIIRLLKHQVSILDNKVDYKRIQAVDWVIGAFIMTTRQAYEYTGGLDDAFFMYAEDLDLCTRTRQKGLEVVYYPEVSICYKGSRRARSSCKYAKIFIRSHLHYWRKFGFFSGYPKRTNLSF